MKSNACASVQELLALRPADWDGSERRQVEEHVAICTECAGVARAYAAQDRALQSLPQAGLDVSARQQLLARLEREKRPRETHSRLSWVVGAVLSAMVLVAISLAVNFLVGQGGWAWGPQKNGPTTGPTQVTMPSPTITPTTSLTPTPVGEKGWPVTTQTYSPGELTGTASSLLASQPSVPNTISGGPCGGSLRCGWAPTREPNSRVSPGYQWIGGKPSPGSSPSGPQSCAASQGVVQ
jgi:hypothetical protein